MMQGREQVRPHLENEDRQGQDERDPEAPGHVGQFRAGSTGHFRDRRLQRHPADRTGTGMILAYLGMHRAGPDRAGRRLGCLPALRFEIACRIGKEPRAAATTAEMIGLARLIDVMRGGGRIDPHAAHRIEHEICLLFPLLMRRRVAACMCLRMRGVVVWFGHGSASCCP